MMPVQGLFFDLDDTLLDNSAAPEVLIKTCAQFAAAQPRVNADRLLEANREVWRAYWPGVEEQWTLGVLNGAHVSLEAWRLTLRVCGCNEESLAELVRGMHRQNAREAMRLFDDALALLNLLRDRIPFALISNGASDTQRDKLRTLGIEDQFGVIVISGEVGIAKPDASVFRLCLDKLGLEPQNVWHVGDSLKTDVAGARAAGLSAVWLNRSGDPWREGEAKPDYEIRSLTELAALVSLAL